tara:strand:- start:1616 stop:2086 length:471 start_codon:yes stop_codon:yes gene_type:complete
MHPAEEMRYWPRLGIYVSRIDAEAYCSKVGGRHTHLDDDLEEFVPVSTHDEVAMRAEVKILFDSPPLESPVLSDEIQLMVKTIEFEQNRVATIKKWIKEDGMDKQEAKDLFQKQMDSMVRDALGLPDETEQERIYREKAAAVRDARLVEENADSEE